jgi:hypothetical protein
MNEKLQANPAQSQHKKQGAGLSIKMKFCLVARCEGGFSPAIHVKSLTKIDWNIFAFGATVKHR